RSRYTERFGYRWFWAPPASVPIPTLWTQPSDKSTEWRAHVLGIPQGRRCRYIPSVAANDPRAGSAYRISSVDAPTTRDQWWDAAKLQSPDSGLAQDCWRSFQFRSEEHTSELQSRFDLVCRL